MWGEGGLLLIQLYWLLTAQGKKEKKSTLATQSDGGYAAPAGGCCRAKARRLKALPRQDFCVAVLACVSGYGMMIYAMAWVVIL